MDIVFTKKIDFIKIESGMKRDIQAQGMLANPELNTFGTVNRLVGGFSSV